MILLLTKKTDTCRSAQRLAKILMDDVVVVEGDKNPKMIEIFPEIPPFKFDAVISFLSPWIIPPWLLDSTPLAINFHPGSDEYPGYGCYNFALYEGSKEFGAVCHHMKPKVDTGSIIKLAKFPIAQYETVETLKERTMVELLALFHQVCGLIATNQPLPESTEQWKRRPFTKRELEALCEIKPDMNEEEVTKRIKSTKFPGQPGAHVKVGGRYFYA